jgi:hypothetical protein
VAFWLIYQGSEGLTRIIKVKDIGRSRIIVIAILALLAIGYAWALSQNPYRLSSPNPAQIHPYYLSDTLLLLTVLLPYLATWGLGMLAVAKLRIYHTNAPGIIYRRALSALAKGLMAVIISSIVIQLITATSPMLVQVGLEQILLLIYLLIIIYAVGHIWILMGARRLAFIEEASR